MPTNPELSLIIPLHNEESVLPFFWRRLREVLERLNISREIVFVDDGSTDSTWCQIRSLAKQDEQILGLRFTRNFGKEAAIQAGLEHAKGRAVVVMDSDGQHPPELLPEMLRLWREEGAPVVAAQKRSRVHDGLFQRVYARLFNRVMRGLTGLELEGGTDYRLLDRRVVDTLLACPERARFFRGMTAWSGFECRPLLFDVPPRLAGSSHWPRKALFNLALQAIVAYSAAPLYYVFGAGLLGLLVSFLLGLQALYSWLSGIAVSGWTSLTVLMLFFGSANLLGLGILGLYLAQLFAEIKKRPAYLIQETSGPKCNAPD